jgi:hypothetical protein
VIFCQQFHPRTGAVATSVLHSENVTFVWEGIPLPQSNPRREPGINRIGLKTLCQFLRVDSVNGILNAIIKIQRHMPVGVFF